MAVGRNNVPKSGPEPSPDEPPERSRPFEPPLGGKKSRPPALPAKPEDVRKSRLSTPALPIPRLAMAALAPDSRANAAPDNSRSIASCSADLRLPAWATLGGRLLDCISGKSGAGAEISARGGGVGVAGGGRGVSLADVLNELNPSNAGKGISPC